LRLEKDMKILIVGLGLLGGSYAMALKAKGYHVKAITKDQSSIDYAINRGIIDEGAAEIIPEWVGEADLIIFALYPHIFIEWIKAHNSLLKAGTYITDVTGVKGAVVYEIQKMLPVGVEFISAHPMAGKEVYGVENADDGIFRNANYIVVPTEKNSQRAITLCEDLGRVLGFKSVSRLSVDEHDEMIAFLSQLTHCIAVALMCCHDNPDLDKYTGDSFRDLTRIAKINDEMWSELFVMNKQQLLSQMKIFAARFERLMQNLEAENIDDMRSMMRLSTERRAHFDR